MSWNSVTSANLGVLLAAVSGAAIAGAGGGGVTLPRGGVVYPPGGEYQTSREARAHLGAPPAGCLDRSGKNACTIVFLPTGSEMKTGWAAAWGKGLHTVCVDEKTASLQVECSDPDAVAILPPRTTRICSPNDRTKCTGGEEISLKRRDSRPSH